MFITLSHSTDGTQGVQRGGGTGTEATPLGSQASASRRQCLSLGPVVDQQPSLIVPGGIPVPDTLRASMESADWPWLPLGHSGGAGGRQLSASLDPRCLPEMGQVRVGGVRREKKKKRAT